MTAFDGDAANQQAGAPDTAALDADSASSTRRGRRRRFGRLRHLRWSRPIAPDGAPCGDATSSLTPRTRQAVRSIARLTIG